MGDANRLPWLQKFLLDGDHHAFRGAMVVFCDCNVVYLGFSTDGVCDCNRSTWVLPPQGRGAVVQRNCIGVALLCRCPSDPIRSSKFNVRIGITTKNVPGITTLRPEKER